MSPKHKIHEQNHISAHHNQIAQNPNDKQNL